ncbi:hypothetical protein EDB89DRAFT_2062522 [Lactarius sanguifluus]|nr:hypothetical protein EDB89DRAFT_2062522 [Lactarius sanguifluus]
MTFAFFYGTLMHPDVLKWVLDNDASHLKICPSILLDYTRYKVKVWLMCGRLSTQSSSLAIISTFTHVDSLYQNVDFPAILPRERSKVLLGRELTSEENCVRGTLVSGLTAEDIALLDEFEGEALLVHPLGPFAPVPVDTMTSGAVEDNMILVDPPPLPVTGELAQAVPAQTYVWCLNDNYLNKELWSFDEFIRKNAWK